MINDNKTIHTLHVASYNVNCEQTVELNIQWSYEFNLLIVSVFLVDPKCRPIDPFWLVSTCFCYLPSMIKCKQHDLLLL